MEKIKIFKDNYLACLNIAELLKSLNNKSASIAISGGSSPILLFNIMKDEFKAEDFNNLKFFWVDERFVEKESVESNFGNFSKILIENNIISEKQVFPMFKDLSRDKTIERVEKQIKENVPYSNNLPCFDLIILGLGDDGHTASLFPDNLTSLDSQDVIIKTAHPKTKQKRLTLTKTVINNSKKIIFLCLGQAKAEMVKKVLIDKNKTLPSSFIKDDESVFWFLDKKAALLI